MVRQRCTRKKSDNDGDDGGEMFLSVLWEAVRALVDRAQFT